MAQRDVVLQVVAIAPSVACTHHQALGLEVVQDVLHRTLGDAGTVVHLTQHELELPGEADQNCAWMDRNVQARAVAESALGGGAELLPR